MIGRISAVLLALTVCLPGKGRGAEVDSDMRFWLFTECQPVSFYVYYPPDSGFGKTVTGMDTQSIETIAEIRLRNARLFDSDSPRVLRIKVIVVADTYHVTVEFMKPVRDAFDQEGRAATWSTGSSGVHGDDANHLITSIAQHVDHFLVDYLRVNEEACG